jgi:DNA polymerase-1
VLQEIQDLEEEADEDAVDYWRTASSAVFSNMKPDSTNTYMLFWLASQHEFPRTMVDWRILDKKLGTYYHGYRNIMRRGGRIHPRFRITGARTGRVSCTDPNIHGVARKKEIKRIFVADEDYVILYSDRSQAEIRMLAHMSGDESLRHACESEDMHFAIACDLFQLTPEQLRAKGKEQVEFMRRGCQDHRLRDHLWSYA